MPNFPPDTTKREAAEFNLIDLDGQELNSEDLKGDVVVINFWGIKCKPCIQEIPQLNSYTEKFNTNKIHFIGITSDSKDDLFEFIKEHPFKYKICSTSEYQKLMLDFNKFPAVPIHFIIDKDWQIVYRYVGKLEGDAFIRFKQIVDRELHK